MRRCGTAWTDELDLPAEIAAGIDDRQARMLERRNLLEQACDARGLRPAHRDLARARGPPPALRWRSGRSWPPARSTTINDLITYNLDIRQFAQDVIENCEGPELLRAFWHAIEQVTVLDPTCGSGAFLFAALNILEPLYEACLDAHGGLRRRSRPAAKHHPEQVQRLPRRSLERDGASTPTAATSSSSPSSSTTSTAWTSWTRRSRSASCASSSSWWPRWRRVEQIEPLPDIDFNIRAGNTLVGFASSSRSGRRRRRWHALRRSGWHGNSGPNARG